MEKRKRTLLSRKILLLVSLNPQEEVPCATLLEKTHEGRTDGLRLGRGDLGDPAVAENEGSGDLLELEVAGHVGVDEHLGHLAVRHHAVVREGVSVCREGRRNKETHNLGMRSTA
jgi:hypothetical protein